ncbi:MAG: patatin-like phospholipase family protein [Puniceicoccales bacterium]|nr:patatin-like phospholipase family protein [Puniceicoccales bacterium]
MVTLLTFTGGGSCGLLLLCGCIQWTPGIGIALIAMAGVASLSAVLCIILRLCLFYSKRHKKQLLEEYTTIIQSDPSAAQPGDSGKRLLNSLNAEWEAASWFAMTQPGSVVEKTTMRNSFENLQKCKLAYELDTFDSILKQDLTEEQLQKVEEIKKKVREDFAAELQILTKSSEYATRAQYTTMSDFFIIQEYQLITAAHEAGLTNYALPKQELKIHYLSMSGGGARGYAYGETIKELAPYFADDCLFSGTSAGAIAALISALGMKNREELITGIQEVHAKSSKSNQHLAAAYAWLNEKFAPWPSYYDFTGVFALFAENIQDMIREFLLEIPEDVIRTTFSTSPAIQERMLLLRTPSDARKERQPTFQDISFLRKLPGGKTQFHHFATAIWDMTAKKLLFAQKKTQPDMPLVVAVYASMAIPLVCKFPYWNLGTADGKAHQLCDGSYGANLPVHAYDYKSIGDAGKVCVVFDCDGIGPRCVNGVVKIFPWIYRAASKVLGIAPNIDKDVLAEAERQRQYARDFLVVPHGGLHMFPFKCTKEERKAIRHQVHRRTNAWLACRKCGKHWPESLWPKK